MNPRILEKDLREFCIQAFRKAGLDPADAGIVADVLVMTDTWGTYSHGTGAVLNYVRALRAGGIDPRAKPRMAAEGDSWGIVDGQAAMGMVSSHLAMSKAIENASQSTIAWVGVRNSSHFGACGYYANMAARQDMVGIAMSNADPNMTVPGARGHVIGNNPIAYAAPVQDDNPLLLDIALSSVAAAKILSMKSLGRSIPSGWLTDAEGLPASEVGEWPASGSMVPMAAHKGYGLAVLVEILTGVMTGAGILDEARSWILSHSSKANLGHAFIAINIGAILPIDRFKTRMRDMVRRLRSSPTAKDAARIYVPGEAEWERRADALRNGIPLPEATLLSLRLAAQECDLPLPLIAT